MTVPTVKNHPEQQPDEHWVGNTPTATWPRPYLASLKTTRLGEQAYCIDGAKLDPREYRPLFIGASEYAAYDRIMMQRLSDIRSGRAKA